jgi:holo-[acyl-carrier protein] synthase
VLLGIGTDILLIDRVRRSLDSPSFVRKTFTEMETRLAESRPDPGNYYAKVFAAKEAVFKCFGVTADSLGSWRDIEIIDSDERQPEVSLHGPLASTAASLGVERVLLSLSYDTEYAVAFAALIGEDQHGD